MMTAIISRGRWKNAGGADAGGSARSPSCTSTWKRTARCITTPRKMCCGSREEWPRSPRRLGESGETTFFCSWRARAQNCWRRAPNGQLRPWILRFILGGTRCSLSAYFDAARVLGGDQGARCRDFALKTLDRLLAGAWDDTRGFPHRMGGEWLSGTLDDQAFMLLALLDAYEATLEKKYFAAAELAMVRVLVQYWDSERWILRSSL